MSRSTVRPSPLAVLAMAVVPGLAGPAAGQGLRDCVRLVVADAFADPGLGTFSGAVIDVDLDLPADANTAIAGGSDLTAFLSHVTVGPGRVVYLSDMEADPGGIGPDPGGNPGPGAVFAMDPGTGALQVVSDGTICSGPIACPAFGDPIGIAWHAGLQALVVVDLDADPSGLGPDLNGFAGHGAIYSVDPVTGEVALIADGSNYPAGIPGGRPSIFEDPIAVDVALDGTIVVADQLARPTGNESGAVFLVDPATGEVSLASALPSIRGPRDVAFEPGGTILLLDRLAGGRGTLFRLDPAGDPVNNLVAALTPQEFVEPAGLVVHGNGTIHVLDASADPFFTEVFGSIFEIDAALSTVSLVSATRDYSAPWGMAPTEPISLDSASPASGATGTSLTVRLTGGPFVDTPTVDFGPDIVVDGVTFVSATQLDVDVTIPAGAALGLRDVAVTNPDFLSAFHCELFEVTWNPGCAPSGPVESPLRVRLTEGLDVVLWWPDVADACRAGYVTYRALDTAVPPPATPWPAHLVPIQDVDGSEVDATATHVREPGRDEYFVVVPVGTDGSEGPAEHYLP